MDQEGPSFWTDIKKFEDTLERDPNSYCFAPLSELYRKLGMVDDAITIAKRGCEIHPEYVGGHMALGRAYFEKGMNPEAKESLGKVVRVTPENLLAQRILSKIYLDEGDTSSAEESLKAILTHNPEDSESRMLLDSLIRTSPFVSKPMPASDDKGFAISDDDASESKDDISSWEVIEEFIDLEGCEIIEELTCEQSQELQEEEEDGFEFDSSHNADEEKVTLSGDREAEEKDPLSTVTLAELYISQGYPEMALNIFRELLDSDPENIELKNRIHTLQQEIDKGEEASEKRSQGADFTGQEYREPVAEIAASLSTSELFEDPNEAQEKDIESVQDLNRFEEFGVAISTPEVVEEESVGIPVYEISPQAEDQADLSEKEDLKMEAGLPSVSDENVIRNLEILLENIKRRR
jgi:tetratricopeptide (TPR) repeat protein